MFGSIHNVFTFAIQNKPNMTTKTTYRVTFTQETIEGKKQFSSRWYASLHEAQTSKFVDFTNAKIEERISDVLKFKPLAR